jgi:hypothetical protein
VAYRQVVLGFVVSIVGGDIVTRPLVVRMWRYVRKHGNLPEEHTRKTGMLSMPLGMLERGIYTGALMLGVWQLIGGWFVLKVSAKWKEPSAYRGADNVWLIGTGLSLLLGFIGAWIALGHIPLIR